MILSFKTKINGKPTYFPDKVIKGLHNSIHENLIKDFLMDQSADLLFGNLVEPDYPQISLDEINPKLTTIRTDEKDRWKKGVLIDFFINARQKNMFRFAPRIPVVSTQKIYMSYAYNDIIEITIDGKYIYDFKEKEQLAINDGFDSYEDFFNYFYPIIKSSEDEFYKGKIIHWTDLRY